MIGIPDRVHVELLAREVTNPSSTCVIAFHPGNDGSIARIKRYLPPVNRPQYAIAWYWAMTFANYAIEDGETYRDAMVYLQKYAQPPLNAPNLQSGTSRKISAAHKRMAQTLQLEKDSVLFCVTDEKVRVYMPDHIPTDAKCPPHALLAMALTELITNRADEAIIAMQKARDLR